MTVTAETRAAWRAARTALDEIEAERRTLLAPTDARHRAALTALAAIEDQHLAEIEPCLNCGAPIFPDDRRFWNYEDSPSCAACAPTWADLQAHPALFVDADGEPMAENEVAAMIAAHLSDGGALTDSMAT